jgi:hypothetical protein
LLTLSRACFKPSPTRKFSTTTLFAVFAIALPRLAMAGAWLLAPGEHYSIIGGSFFSSDSYYDSSGTRSALRGGGLHEEKSVFAYNEFGWTKGRTFILGLPFTSVTRRLGTPDDSSRTETGFGDLLVGVRWKLKGGPQALSLETDWIPPLGYNRNLSPRLGDGASSLLGKLAYGETLGHSGFFELEGGYRYYTEKLAPTGQMLAGATLAYWFGNSVMISGRYDGQFGASSSDTLYRALIVKTPDGRTWTNSDARPYTTNDQIMVQTVSPMLLYRVDDHLDLMVGSSHSFSAKNALHVDRVYVAVALRQTKLGPLQGFMGGRR